jgi:DMSO/TMAO reductase YedYZ molybdopterin-dependent catalytic subunit
MTAAALDRLLAVLVAALATTGLVSLRMGAPGDAWLFAVHGLLAGALALTACWKIARSLPKAVKARRWRRVALGTILSLATVAALVAGFAWVASGRLLTVGSWTVLTIHAWIGLILLPLAVIHLAPRRWRLLVPRRAASHAAGPVLSRRRLVSAGVVAVGSIAIFGFAQLAERLTGGDRRFTGSRWLPAGGVPPTTTFLGDSVPAVDPGAWRLHVTSGGNEAWLSLDALRELGVEDRTTVLDCTSGWAIETSWQGVPLRAVIDAAGRGVGRTHGGRVTIRSVTGWASTLEPDEVDRALLATGVAGVALPSANGAPCRLVVPDRRGLDWVKWVAEVELA